MESAAVDNQQDENFNEKENENENINDKNNHKLDVNTKDKISNFHLISSTVCSTE